MASKRGKVQSLENKERARKAVDMKIAGATWPEVAAAIDMQTEAGARDLVRRYFAFTAKTQFEDMHPILLERAELLWRKAWTKLNQVQKDDRPIEEWDKAMQRCVSVLQTIARISGIGDGPKVQINVTSSADVKRLRDEFLQLHAGPPTVDGIVE